MGTIGGFDASSMGDSFAAPGIDPRTHISFALVAKGDENNPPVEFDEEDGQVYVNVVLQPTKLNVRARVANGVAGNGEGEYFPFLENDEVIVAIPEGDERAGVTIIGRMNNVHDAFPRSVAGQDATGNLFAFRRLRTPYILETASSYMVRSATTRSFWSIGTDGALTFSDGNANMMHVGADFIGMASGDNKVLMQLDLHKNQFVTEANGTKLVLDKDESVFTTAGVLKLGTTGGAPVHHVTTIESMAVLLEKVLTALGAALAISSPGPITGPAFAAATVAPPVVAIINAALAAAGVGSSAPYTGALKTALMVPPTPVTPGVGKIGLMV